MARIPDSLILTMRDPGDEVTGNTSRDFGSSGGGHFVSEEEGHKAIFQVPVKPYKMPTVQARFWCWTLNNPTDEESTFLQSVITQWGEESNIRYLVFQKESGEEGTPHYQGYVEFKTKRTMAQVKTALGSTRVHLEQRRGTPQEADDYCQKEESRLEGPWKCGTRSQGTWSYCPTHTDLDLELIADWIGDLCWHHTVRNTFYGHECNDPYCVNNVP